MTVQNPPIEAHQQELPAHGPHLHIFVNRKKFDEGITPVMTVDAIAKLVGLSAATATVRRDHGGKPSEPLQGEVEIKQADHFIVTRKQVEGGFEDPFTRVEAELARLREGTQRVELLRPHRAVLYYGLPTASGAPVSSTDVLVPVPGGYPASMLDLAFLPEGSPLIGRVKGAPQNLLVLDGRTWRQMSYHPHQNGGGPPWNPQRHGFHTYIDELLTWLGRIQ